MRQREIEHEWGRVRERGRHSIRNRLQALSCQHRARRGARTHRPRDHDPSRSRPLNRLSHPGAPTCCIFYVSCSGWSLILLHIILYTSHISGNMVFSWLGGVRSQGSGIERGLTSFLFHLEMVTVGVPGWLIKVEHLTSAQVMISVCEFKPRACFSFCVSLSLWPSPACTLALKIKKNFKN